MKCFGGNYCYLRFGSVMFVVSAVMLAAIGCPKYSRVLEFTWFGQAQIQLQILGFTMMVLLGAIYEILPRIMDTELPFKKLVSMQFFCSMFGTVLFVIPIAIAGVKQGHAGFDPVASKFWLMISTAGLLLLLLGSFALLLNSFAMTLKWKVGLVKTVIAAVTAPLPNTEVKS